MALPHVHLSRLVLGALPLFLSAYASGGPIGIGTPVTTEAGKVRGVAGRDAEIAIFKGIPLAAAPVGDLRWRAPMEAEPWQ